MKKRFVLFAGLILAIVMFSLLVSAVEPAQSPVEALKGFISGAGEVLKTLAENILGPGPTGVEGGGLFARALFLLVVLVVVWAVISRVPLFSSNPWMVFIISAAVALLSTRFLLQKEWVEVILLPYSAFGIAITAFLPLLIYAYFVESAINSKTLRKIAWILAAVVFIGLWYTRRSVLIGGAGYVYPVAAVACFAFLAFDGTIRRAWKKVTIENKLAQDPKKWRIYIEKEKDVQALREALSSTTIPANKKPGIKKQLETAEKELADLLS